MLAKSSLSSPSDILPLRWSKEAYLAIWDQAIWQSGQSGNQAIWQSGNLAIWDLAIWQSGNLAIWHSGIWAIQQSGDQAIWLRQSGNLGNPPRPRVVRFSSWGRSVFDLGSMFRHSAANSAPFWGRSSVDLDMALFGTLSQEIHEI